MTCRENRTNNQITIDIDGMTVTGTPKHIAALMQERRTNTASGAVYVTGGASPVLPPGYSSARTLNDAARAGELHAVPVPRCGYRFTHADLETWETSKRRKARGRHVRRAEAELAAVDARANDRALLARAASR